MLWLVSEVSRSESNASSPKFCSVSRTTSTRISLVGWMWTRTWWWRPFYRVHYEPDEPVQPGFLICLIGLICLICLTWHFLAQNLPLPFPKNRPDPPPKQHKPNRQNIWYFSEDISQPHELGFIYRLLHTIKVPKHKKSESNKIIGL